jgi:hypothetical protein
MVDIFLHNMELKYFILLLLSGLIFLQAKVGFIFIVKVSFLVDTRRAEFMETLTCVSGYQQYDN